MKIHIFDELNPEDEAMLQALYSRSPLSVTKHIKKVRETGSGKFMERFYVGYGHSSIGDCGSTTIFIENVSELAAKAIQDNQMYSGQQTSSRYVDLSKQHRIDPVNTKASATILENWMEFYTTSQAELVEHLKKKYPKGTKEDRGIYSKAIEARGFDSLRSFIPTGNTTQLSWHTNLRQAWDKLSVMRYHQLPEIKLIAEEIISGLNKRYPHSFGYTESNQQLNYRKLINRKYNYYKSANKSFRASTSVSKNKLYKYSDLITRRPEKTCLPPILDDLGQVTFDFVLDYGSFRDIQRHRHGVCKMPLLDYKLGFNKWYLGQLPIVLRQKASELIVKQTKLIRNLKTPAEIKQYYYAMGFNVSCQVTYPLPAAVYVTELRSGRTVHPSLRIIAHKMHHSLQKMFPKLKLYSDLSPDDFDIRRGTQDIVEKK